jgi:hypothetical protein
MNAKIKFSFVCVLLIIGIFVACSIFNAPPVYNGKFEWRKIIVHADIAEYTSGKVFESVNEDFKVIFKLEKGDECYFLHDENWVWRDKKDPFFMLLPIFCPKKGGGWAMPPSELFIQP